MKNFVINLLIAVLVFTGCNREDDITPSVLDKDTGFRTPITENSDNYTVTYQFNDGVMVLNDKAAGFIVKVVADTILYLDAAAPQEMVPAVGDILSSRIQQQLPYGLGNKVLSVSKEDGMYKCVTTVAALDEIFQDLVLNAVVPITAAITDGVYDTDGEFHPVGGNSRVTVNPKTLTLTLGKNSLKENEKFKGVYPFGQLNIDTYAVIEMDLKKKTHEFSLQVDGSFVAGIEAAFDVSKGDVVFPYLKVPILSNGFFVAGPVVFRPHVNLEVGYKAGLAGSIKYAFTKPFGFKIGLKNGKFFNNNLLDDSNDKIFSELQWDAEGYVGLFAELAFGVGLYTKSLAVYLAPTLDVLGKASLSMKNLDISQVSPTLGFDGVLSLNATAELNLLGKEYWHQQETFLSYPLFENSWPLLPSLVPNSTKVTPDETEKHLTFLAEYDYTGGLLSHFIDIHPIFRVYDDLGEAKCFQTDKVLSPEQDVQHFIFKVDGLQYDKEYMGKPGIQFMGSMFDNTGVTFRAKSPEPEDNEGDTGDDSSGTETGGDGGNTESGGGTPQEGCEGCAAGHCHAHNYFKKDE